VVAVERGEVAVIARRVAAANGLAGRVVVHRRDSRRLRLSRRADVLVTETFGEGIFDEGILEHVEDARRRLLRRGARVIPRAVWMEAMPAQAGRALRAHLAIGRAEGVDLSPAAAVARHAPTFTEDPPAARLADPRPLLRCRLQGGAPVRGPADGTAHFRVRRGGRLDGILATLALDLAPGVWLTGWQRTHWARLFFPVHAPVRVRRGDRVTFRCGLRERWAYDWDVVVRRGGRTIARSEHRQLFAHGPFLEAVDRMRGKCPSTPLRGVYTERQRSAQG
jgi:hypothetical protein